ncbi:MAG: hypothetical protein ACOX42_02390 [Clostridia bacterium]
MLEEDHYGLEKVKGKGCWSYLAIRQLATDMKGPNPVPCGDRRGWGKTSIGPGPIAPGPLIGKFVRMSLGGVRDEGGKSAGHRRTYVGRHSRQDNILYAPGPVSNNPVFFARRG